MKAITTEILEALDLALERANCESEHSLQAQVAYVARKYDVSSSLLLAAYENMYYETHSYADSGA